MAWSAPVPGIATQIITAAWSQANVVDLLNWLRLMTGNADPPDTGYTILSLSPTQTVWGKLTAPYINAGAILDTHIADPKVSKTLTNYANLALAGAAGSGYSSSFQSGGNVDGPSASDWFVQTLNVGTRQLQIITSIYDEGLTYIRLIVAGTPTSWKQMWNSGNDGTSTALDAGLFGGQLPAFYATASSVAAINTVPSGAVVAFRTAAEVTAAGAGWAVETNLAGRIIIGAGTAGGATFVEATNYGTNWTVATTATAATGGGTVQGGGSSSADPQGHTHPVSVALTPPARAYVHARKS